jgi:phosphoribosylaminoimidazole carboxylase PurE protein
MAKSNNSRQRPVVGILMGSDTDLPVMNEAAKTLEKFGIPYELEVISAHRSPERTHEYASTARDRGLKAIIVGAGGAAHLAGVVASLTILPVIGVPLSTTALNGLDSLLSTVQMPGGIPVATVSLDKAGAVNAAILAAQILGTSDEGIARKLLAYKEELARSVSEKNSKLKVSLGNSK